MRKEEAIELDQYEDKSGPETPTENSPLLKPQQTHSTIKKRVAYGSLIVLGAATPTAIIVIIVKLLSKNRNSIPNQDPRIKFLAETAVILDQNTDNKIPLSFFVTKNYWEYICSLADCSLKTPKGIALQTERNMATNGQDIYDAATAQIALGHAGLVNKAKNQVLFLINNRDPDANPYSTLRAVSDASKPPSDTFVYNGHYITDSKAAYNFRMVGNYINRDPLRGFGPIPANATVQWVDWKPITGENAWAHFIGALQTAFFSAERNVKKISMSDIAIQLAHQLLPTIKKMQSKIGAIYFTTSDTAANQGKEQVNPFQVSSENNVSILAGLRMYYEVLMQHKDETFPDGTTVADELKELKPIINGILRYFKDYAFDAENGIFYSGGLANDPDQTSTWVPDTEPFAVDVQTWGLTILAPLIEKQHGVGSAFKMWNTTKALAGYHEEAYGNQVRGVGYSNQPKPIDSSIITVNATNADQPHDIKAVALFKNSTSVILSPQPILPGQSQIVSVPTDNLSALQFIDENFNQVAKIDSGSFNDKAQITVSWQKAIVKITEWGPLHSILSGEWTFGAINALKALANYYRTQGEESYAAACDQDASSMQAGVQLLRNDIYAMRGDAPASALVPIPPDQQAFLYANKRYFIPFGWFANFIPSTASTAWSYLVDNNYNPFRLNGNYDPIDWDADHLYDEDHDALSLVEVNSEQSASTESRVAIYDPEQSTFQSALVGMLSLSFIYGFLSNISLRMLDYLLDFLFPTDSKKEHQDNLNRYINNVTVKNALKIGIPLRIMYNANLSIKQSIISQILMLYYQDDLGHHTTKSSIMALSGGIIYNLVESGEIFNLDSILISLLSVAASVAGGLAALGVMYLVKQTALMAYNTSSKLYQFGWASIFKTGTQPESKEADTDNVQRLVV